MLLLFVVYNKHKKLGTTRLSIGNGIQESVVLPPYHGVLCDDEDELDLFILTQRDVRIHCYSGNANCRVIKSVMTLLVFC